MLGALERSIQEKEKAEEETAKIEQQLQLAGRLAAVGELAAGVAHELNNPLAAVQAFAQFLADRDDMDETAKSDLQTIYKEAQRATRITGNLLSFARKHNPERSLISINEVIVKSLELHIYRMNLNNIEIVTDFDPDLPMTMADFHQIQQVFANIITNAEQAMTEAHGGGKLVIKTHPMGELIQVTFTDNGPGILKENFKSIFDPFYTTKEVGEGTGLGLSICYGIMQEHGGRIYTESKVDEGTTFVVEIPVVSKATTADETDSTHHLQSTPHYM
jgi:two-component system NtrC family sensor kinase